MYNNNILLLLCVCVCVCLRLTRSYVKRIAEPQSTWRPEKDAIPCNWYVIIMTSSTLQVSCSLCLRVCIVWMGCFGSGFYFFFSSGFSFFSSLATDLHVASVLYTHVFSCTFVYTCTCTCISRTLFCLGFS